MTKKIVIFEDSESDLIERYGFLNDPDSENEVYVFLHLSYINEKKLKKAGFNHVYKGVPKQLLSENFLNEMNTKNRIHQGKLILNDEKFIEADHYFSDGLEELCFEIGKNLPRDKFQIWSSHMGIMRRAEEQGYKVYLPRIN